MSPLLSMSTLSLPICLSISHQFLQFVNFFIDSGSDIGSILSQFCILLRRFFLHVLFVNLFGNARIVISSVNLAFGFLVRSFIRIGFFGFLLCVVFLSFVLVLVLCRARTPCPVFF